MAPKKIMLAFPFYESNTCLTAQGIDHLFLLKLFRGLLLGCPGNVLTLIAEYFNQSHLATREYWAFTSPYNPQNSKDLTSRLMNKERPLGEDVRGVIQKATYPKSENVSLLDTRERNLAFLAYYQSAWESIQTLEEPISFVCQSLLLV